MIKSMTGFGRGLAQEDGYCITVEMKSVNHRFLDIAVRQPKSFSMLEDGLKKQIQSAVSRGKIDVFITLDDLAAKKTVVKVDKELAIAYYNAMLELAETCQLPSDVRLQNVAACNGVLTVESLDDDRETLARLLTQATAEALFGFCDMRRVEGAALYSDLVAHLEQIAQAVEKIASYAPQIVEEQYARLQQRIGELLRGIEIDPGRLANEVAFFADKVDISEELARLNSHMSQFRLALESEEPVGRQLEFILQEMLRETNTIGSKSNALEINKLVIAVKCELEKIREQIQNVE